MALTQERLKEVLDYNPETGVFVRKVYSSWKAKAGDIAGYIQHNGYNSINVDAKPYLAHRLAWLYIYGYFPENTVDHINRNRGDNRIINLREASYQCQMRNRSGLKNNTSGIEGVSWSNWARKWIAAIKVNRKIHALGSFTDKLEAAYARYTAEVCLGFRACNTTSTALKFIKESANG